MARYVSANLLADNAEFDRAWERSAATAEVTADKIARSAQMAARSAAAQAKAAGASASEQQAAAARAAVSYTEAAEKITKAQQAAGKAAMDAAKAAGASADEQVAAWKKAVAATGEYEAAQRKTADAAEASAARIKAAHDKLVGLGKWTIAGGLGAGFFAVKGATELQAQMERLHTQAGASQKQVQQLTGSVLNMAGALGSSPQQMSQGLYQIVSTMNKVLPATTRNVTELKLLKIAAEGAKVGGANLVDVENALDSAVVSGVRGVGNYTHAMGALNATVGAGKMTMQDLADALGTGLLGPMKTYGLSIKDVGGALALFGDNSIFGQEAATKLNSAIRIMAAPSKEAAKALAVVGISATQLADDMRNGGIVKAITDLRDHLKESGLTASEQALVITRAFGGRQSTGVQLMVGQLDRLQAATKQVGSGMHTFGGDWAATTHTMKFQLDQVTASAQAEGDKIGMWLLPKIHDLIVVTEDVTNWLGKHKAAADALAATLGLVLGAAITVYAYTKAVAFVKATKGMIDGLQQLAGKLTGTSDTMKSTSSSMAGAQAAAATEIEGSNSAIEASNAAAGASFQTVATDAETAVAKTDSQMALFSETVTTENDAVIASNEAAGASFTRLIPIIGGVVLAAQALQGPLNSLSHSVYNATGGMLGSGSSYTGKRGQYTQAQAMAEAKKIAAHSSGLVTSQQAYATILHGGGIKGTPQAQQHSQYGPGPDAIRQTVGVRGPVSGAAISPSATTTTPSQFMAWMEQHAGLSKNAAAGIAGNIGGAEDTGWYGGQWQGGSPVGAPTSGYGLVQWSTAGYHAGLAAMAKRMGQPISSIAVQEAYLKSTMSPGLIAQLNAAQTPAGAAAIFEQQYERAGIINMAGRTGAAQKYAAGGPSPSTLAAYNALVGSGPSSSTMGRKPTMRYYQHHPVGVMNEAQWQAFEATHAAAAKEAAQAHKEALHRAALVKHATTTGDSMLGRFQSVTQSGTSRTLENALGVNTSKIAFSEFQPQHGFGSEFAPTLAALIHSSIEHGHPLGGLLNRASQGSEATTKYQNELVALTKSGQDKLADKLVAAHKAAMAALANTLIAEQKTRDGQMLEQQATALKDQTAGLQNMAQDLQTVFQAQEQKANNMASATVQAMQDMQQTVNDRMAGMVQAVNDATRLSADQSSGIVTAINDQTQIQVDQIGERGLYGLNLVAQKLQVQADITKAGFDQQISTATQQLDSLQMQANQQENLAQLNVDQVTAQQHALVAAAQQRLDIVTLRQDTRIASAQAHADAVQLHVDTSLIGPAQMALDMNANASKSVQAKFQAQLTAATGLGDTQIAGAQQALQKVQASAQSAIDAAQSTYDQASATANQMIQGAQDNLANMTNQYNLLIATAQGNLQTLENTAAQTEATQAGQIAVTQGEASTQFAGSGLVINQYGVDLTNPASVSDAASWAIRSSGLATV